MRFHTGLATNDAPELFEALEQRVNAFLQKYPVQHRIRSTRTKRRNNNLLQKMATTYHHQIELIFVGKATVVNYSISETEYFSIAQLLTAHAKAVYECAIRVTSFEDFCNAYGASPDLEGDAMYYQKMCWLAGQYERLFPKAVYTAFSHLAEDLYELDEEGK